MRRHVLGERLLQRRRRRERHVLVHAPQLRRQLGRRDAVAELPARRVVGLAEREHGEAALRELRLRQRRRVPRAVEHDVLVNLVARADSSRTGAAAPRAGRSPRASSSAPLGLCGELTMTRRVRSFSARAQPLPVDREIGLRQRQVDGAAAGQRDRRLVGVVARVEHDDFVVAAHDGLDRVEDRLRGAARDRDLRDGIGLHAVQRRELLRDRRAQRHRARHQRVLVVAPAQRSARRARSSSAGGEKSGNPCERFTARCCSASCDINVKIVVPTFGSLLSMGFMTWCAESPRARRSRSGGRLCPG